jgi:hypothetical protein
MNGPSIFGTVKKGSRKLRNGEVVLKIREMNGSYSQDYRVPETGLFHVILNPGTYQVTAESAGSPPVKMDPVVVANTRVPVQLKLP